MYTSIQVSLAMKPTNSHQNLPVSHYLGTKLDMLFEIGKPVEMVIILGKTAVLP